MPLVVTVLNKNGRVRKTTASDGLVDALVIAAASSRRKTSADSAFDEQARETYPQLMASTASFNWAVNTGAADDDGSDE